MDIQSRMFELQEQREKAEEQGDFHTSHKLQLRIATLADRLQDI